MVTGSPITSTADPSGTVVITGEPVDGPVRMFAPAPSVFTMTNPPVASEDGDANGEGELPGDPGR